MQRCLVINDLMQVCWYIRKHDKLVSSYQKMRSMLHSFALGTQRFDMSPLYLESKKVATCLYSMTDGVDKQSYMHTRRFLCCFM